jgi:ABC-type antimicrobial peptide transport system permease subunit
MDSALAAQLYPFLAAYWVSSAIGGVALLLTLSGIYGVLSYLVTQRTKEIGIRVALGASTRSVATLVLKQSLKLAGIGAAAGAIAALGVSRILSSEVGGTMFDQPDPATIRARHVTGDGSLRLCRVLSVPARGANRAGDHAAMRLKLGEIREAWEALC